MKDYPLVGRLSVPPCGLMLTKEELLAYKGASEVPPGRVDAPIYIAVKGDVFDVSYGGKEMYGEGSPYIVFTGIDASRALAKMSFKPEDLESSALGDLSEAELKVLDDWHRKYLEARKYPIVGSLVE
jgi:membrane-associated progesterone receptor component